MFALAALPVIIEVVPATDAEAAQATLTADLLAAALGIS